MHEARVRGPSGNWHRSGAGRVRGYTTRIKPRSTEFRERERCGEPNVPNHLSERAECCSVKTELTWVFFRISLPHCSKTPPQTQTQTHTHTHTDVRSSYSSLSPPPWLVFSTRRRWGCPLCWAPMGPGRRHPPESHNNKPHNNYSPPGFSEARILLDSPPMCITASHLNIYKHKNANVQVALDKRVG